MTQIIIPPNASMDFGNHVYCAMGNPGGYSWGEVEATGYVGTNSYGSPLYDFAGQNVGGNYPAVICLDQS